MSDIPAREAAYLIDGLLKGVVRRYGLIGGNGDLIKQIDELCFLLQGSFNCPLL